MWNIKELLLFLKEDRGLQGRTLFDYQASMSTWCYSKYSWLKWHLLSHFLWLGHSQLERNISVLHITFCRDLWKCFRLIVLLLLHRSLQIISMECFFGMVSVRKGINWACRHSPKREFIDVLELESACDQTNENCQLNNYMFSYIRDWVIPHHHCIKQSMFLVTLLVQYLSTPPVDNHQLKVTQ